MNHRRSRKPQPNRRLVGVATHDVLAFVKRTNPYTTLLGDLVRIAGEAAIREDQSTVRLCRAVNYLVRQVRMIAGESDEEHIKERLDGIVPPALKMILPNADVDLPDTAAQDSASKSNNPAVSG